ncbi:hypothetical protein MASR1M97_21210 [Candidatus Desulfobacillus denitrificans]
MACRTSTIDEAAEAGNHRLGKQVGARQFRQRFAADRFDVLAGLQLGIVEGKSQEMLVQLVVILDVTLALAVLDLVERRLGNVNMAALDQFGHLPVEKSQQQCADVCAVDIRVGHDDNAVVAEFLRLVILSFTYARSKCRDQRCYFLRRDKLVEARLLDVEDLALERQNGLELSVSALLGGAAGGVALNQIQFAQRRIFLLAVGELAGQADAIEHTLAPRHFARLARRFPRACCFDDLSGDDSGISRTLKQELRQFGSDDFLHGRLRFRGHQLHFGLRSELRIRHFHREHTGQPLAHVITGDLDLCLLGYVVLFNILVDDAGHCMPQSRKVGSAIGLRDIVGKAQNLLRVGIIPLHRHFDADDASARQRRFAGGVEHRWVQHGLGSVDVLDEACHTAGEGEILFLTYALVDELDLDAVIEE